MASNWELVKKMRRRRDKFGSYWPAGFAAGKNGQQGRGIHFLGRLGECNFLVFWSKFHLECKNPVFRAEKLVFKQTYLQLRHSQLVFNKVWARGCMHGWGKNHPTEQKYGVDANTSNWTNADANAGLTNIWSKRLHELEANAVTEKSATSLQMRAKALQGAVLKEGSLSSCNQGKKLLGLPSKHWPGPTLLNFTLQNSSSPATHPQGRGCASSLTVQLLQDQTPQKGKKNILS